jgi:hypothetical protein
MSLFTTFTSLFRWPTDTSLNGQLSRAVRDSKPTDCRSVLEMRADVNAPDCGQETPLKRALALNDLLIAKILIDYGAKPTPHDEEEIDRLLMRSTLEIEGLTMSEDVDKAKKYFIDSGRAKGWKEAFMLRRPKLYSPEVFNDGQFVPISQLAGKKTEANFTKPLAVVFIADERFLGKNYGVITRKFLESRNGRYEDISDEYHVVRTFVDDREKLVSTIEKIKDFFGLPILFVLFESHGYQQGIGLRGGIDGWFLDKHETVMKQVAQKLHPLATIGCSACNAARGDENFVKTFSRNAEGRIVWGPSHIVGSVKFTVALESATNTSIVIPLFYNREDDDYSVTMFRNGQLVSSYNEDDFRDC